MNPSDYKVTVRYLVSTKLDSPREVIVDNFDYLYIDVAAERISLAIRDDICKMFGLPSAFGSYILIALQNIDKFLTTPSGTSLTKEAII